MKVRKGREVGTVEAVLFGNTVVFEAVRSGLLVPQTLLGRPLQRVSKDGGPQDLAMIQVVEESRDGLRR